MAALAITFRPDVLAWASVPEDDARFRRVLHTVLAAVALVCVVLLLSPAPVLDRAQPPELPARLAKLLVEKDLPPPVKPKVEAPKPTEAVKPEDARAPTLPKAPPLKGAPVPEARNPQPNRPPGEVDAARRKAAGVGLLAMKDELGALHSAPAAAQFNQDIKPGRGIGTGSGPGVGAGTDAGLPDRSMITSNATGGSGGINTAGYSRNTGGSGLAGRGTTLVEGVAGGGGGGGGGYGGGGQGGKGNTLGGGGNPSAGGTLQRGGSGKASRSLEDVRLVFERNKGSIYAIYNRALREDPALQGKVVVELRIAPSGEVMDCRIVSTELKTPDLERKLVARIQQFDFGAKQVEQMVVTYPLDFLPS
ncbi:TonB family protein [Roseateles sp.]|uniref:TonB family protein n=1 Tax=Roseateles sp. TaxID=1971397 RepID=UPI003926C645